MAARTIVAAALLACAAPTGAAAPSPITDTVSVAPGDYFREDIFPPSDGSAWQITAIGINGTGVFDLYIIHTTDFLGAYPGGSFVPVEVRENVNATFVSFIPASRVDAFSLIIDNLDNSRATDVPPSGAIVVTITRTPPLHANPEAQALLATGTSICTAILGFAAVGLAVYLKRRKRPEADDDLVEGAPRIEIPVEIPRPPRGAWASAQAADREAEEAKG